MRRKFMTPLFLFMTDSVISNDGYESEDDEHESNETDAEKNIDEVESENVELEKLWKNLTCIKKNKQFKPSKNVKQNGIVKTVYKSLKNKKKCCYRYYPKNN